MSPVMLAIAASRIWISFFVVFGADVKGRTRFRHRVEPILAVNVGHVLHQLDICSSPYRPRPKIVPPD